MMETFTTTLKPISNEMEENHLEFSQADAELFYQSLHADLERLQQQPKPKTIENILNYSRGL